jgi:hypothetical protein
MKNTKTKRRFFISTTVVAIVAIPTVANANFLGSLLGNGGGVFQSLTSGNFNFSNIGQVVSGVSSSISNPSSFSLGSYSSSGAQNYGLSNLSIGGGFTGQSTLGNGTTGGFGTTGGVFNGGSPGSGGLSPSTIQKINASSGYIQNLFGSVQSQSWGGIINNSLGLLGALGIINPATLSAASGSAGAPLGIPGATTSSASIDDEFDNAKIPIDIWMAGNKKNSVYPQSNWGISQIVLSDDGQKLSDAQAQESTLGVSTAQDASTAAGQYVGQAVSLNGSQEKAAQAASKLSDNCSNAKQSLDCLKNISGGLGVMAGQNALTSAGQTLQISAAYQQAAAAAADVAVNKINGDRLTKIELQAAATNNGVSILAALADQEHQYQLTKEQADLRFMTHSQQTLLAPGLFK